jgi:hypothetical protein
MAVVCGAELNFPDSLLIFVLCVVTSYFRELTFTSVSVPDDTLYPFLMSLEISSALCRCCRPIAVFVVQ